MTCREKLAIEHPECIDNEGGCKYCPSSYGYLEDPPIKDCLALENCNKCWDREIPEEKTSDISETCAVGELNIPEETVDELNAIGNPNPISPDEVHAVIKDSGDRTKFETGAVRDMREGKGRCDLMPLEVVARIIGGNNHFPDPIIDNICLFLDSRETFYLYVALDFFAEKAYNHNFFGGNCPDMMLEVAKHFEEGAKKYGESNWRMGIPVNCYIDSAIRHYLKWLRGDNDEPHDRAFVWNIMCCIWEVDYHKEDTKCQNTDASSQKE